MAWEALQTGTAQFRAAPVQESDWRTAERHGTTPSSRMSDHSELVKPFGTRIWIENEAGGRSQGTQKENSERSVSVFLLIFVFERVGKFWEENSEILTFKFIF